MCFSDPMRPAGFSYAAICQTCRLLTTQTGDALETGDFVVTQPIACIWGWAGHIAPSAEKIRAAAEKGGTAAIFEAGTTPALRLCSDDGRRHRPEALADLGDHAARLAALREEVGRNADLFSRSQRQFLDHYFRFVEDAVADPDPSLGADLAWSGGLFTPADLVFAALRPLPRAVIVAGERKVTADFAFWDGAILTAVSASATSSGREDEADGIRRINVPPADIARGPAIFADPRFPATLRRYFEGIAVPQGPFRPHGLPETLNP